MNLEIKKSLVSNWFKTLQDAFCDDICKLEKNKFKFKLFRKINEIYIIIKVVIYNKIQSLRAKKYFY